MYSWIQRATAVVTFGITTLLLAVILLSVSSSFLNTDPKDINVTIRNVQRFSPYSRYSNDIARISFDISADLSPLFHWNVKQLFVYLTAVYKTPENHLNQVVIWDKIVTSREAAKFDYKNVVNEYDLEDQGHFLRNNTVEFVVSWNVCPKSGLLSWSTGSSSTSYTMPSQYVLY